MTALLVPATAEDEHDRTWIIRRAWPDKEGGVTVEAVHPAERHARAGRMVGGAVELGPLGADRRLPALAEAARSGTVLVHRLGRRAVVREHDGGAYRKIVRAGRAAELAASSAPEGWPAAFTLAAVLEADEQSVRFAALPGRTLRTIGAAEGDEWIAAWRALAEAWADVPGAPASIGAEHGPEREAAVLLAWARMAAPLGPHAPALLRRAERLAERLQDGTAQPLRPAHRDLHDGQVLWHPRHGLGLLDLDTAASAEPALDLGNLLAHLDWRVRQGGLRALRAARIRSMLQRTAAAVDVDPERLRLAERVAALRIACVHRFRPPSRAAAERLLLDELAR
ncbi:aminoglycoside phosphotransferase family protein [Arenivirga flava]|uniref:Aminoglycoside phosphotransferase domain-containing protein n=1 Tax=Arenivirga flava TaxID=1930060 RepID=A0AA37UJ87_9MICO|nr:aminoglycoside phosphotransferase family protein [Arenivirga flava]GMA27950.1 hypothetical protein GCM10025874_12030 [Arenivirga flava]